MASKQEQQQRNTLIAVSTPSQCSSPTGGLFGELMVRAGAIHYRIALYGS